METTLTSSQLMVPTFKLQVLFETEFFKKEINDWFMTLQELCEKLMEQVYGCNSLKRISGNILINREEIEIDTGNKKCTVDCINKMEKIVGNLLEIDAHKNSPLMRCMNYTAIICDVVSQTQSYHLYSHDRSYDICVADFLEKIKMVYQNDPEINHSENRELYTDDKDNSLCVTADLLRYDGRVVRFINGEIGLQSILDKLDLTRDGWYPSRTKITK